MKATHTADSLCGLWTDGAGLAYCALASADGARTVQTRPFSPYCWTDESGADAVPLRGNAPLRFLRAFANEAALRDYATARAKSGDVARIRALETQFLAAYRLRMFQDFPFERLRRVQLDIETSSATPGAFPNPRNAGDRVIAVGLRDERGDTLLVADDATDAAEKRLLERFHTHLQALDPDVIEGHNIFKFDLDFLRWRCKRHRLPLAWGRFGRAAAFRPSRLKIAERTVDFPRCDIPGRAVFDTYLALQIFDIANRDLPSYSLKAAARYFGFTREADARTYIDGGEIGRVFFEDRERFLKYLSDDLRETRALGGLLLPTYFAQAKILPMTLQEVFLRGNAQKVETLLLERYLEAREALPRPPSVGAIEGGFTASFGEGVFKNVLHFDVASMYPSLMLALGRNPADDTLGAFIPLLSHLRAERLRCKRLAREGAPEKRAEYAARQASFKILINSFYGYLAFAGARFADSDLAAEITRRGRALIAGVIEKFGALGVRVLEADTDGVYVEGGAYFKAPEALLEKVRGGLPQGVDLEFDGAYDAMWCYKAKNYALAENGRAHVRGSALRSRAMEPFLKTLTDTLVRGLLGLPDGDVDACLARTRERLSDGSYPVSELAKTEFLNVNPATYPKEVEAGKPRRAALEVALKMTPMPKLGERVRYYVGVGEKAKSPDWKVARPLSQYDAKTAPYDAAYYLRKLADWQKRYAAFLKAAPTAPAHVQGELL